MIGGTEKKNYWFGIFCIKMKCFKFVIWTLNKFEKIEVDLTLLVGIKDPLCPEVADSVK